MPGATLQTDAFVLHKRPPSDTFVALTVFSPEKGLLQVLQRLPKRTPATPRRASGGAAVNHPLDLFDEAALLLESTPEGRSWFVKEARLLNRPEAIGRDYETLRCASELAALIRRHPGPEESHARLAALLRTAFAAFAAGHRPDIVYLKSLYCFSRDEGYPVREEWLARLSSADRAATENILHQPVATQTAPPEEVARLRRRLEDYLRGFTEILPE
jgi:hypothetical protein